jgi:hypothetical protein
MKKFFALLMLGFIILDRLINVDYEYDNSTTCIYSGGI